MTQAIVSITEKTNAKTTKESNVLDRINPASGIRSHKRQHGEDSATHELWPRRRRFVFFPSSLAGVIS